MLQSTTSDFWLKCCSLYTHANVSNHLARHDAAGKYPYPHWSTIFMKCVSG